MHTMTRSARAAAGVKEGTEITFEEGTKLTITRDANARLSADTIPVQCELPFTKLDLRTGMDLHVSTFLAIGALPPIGQHGSSIICCARSAISLACERGVHGAQLTFDLHHKDSSTQRALFAHAW